VTSLDRESRVFSRYLLGSVADDAILDTYAAAVASGTAGPCPESGAFDRLLTRVARIHPAATRAVDVYARHFCAAAPVRKRLILMLAILESYARPYAVMDTVDGGGRALVYLRIGGAVISSLFLLVLATAFLSPVRLVMGGRTAGEG
jgi:hypothetical protein